MSSIEAIYRGLNEAESYLVQGAEHAFEARTTQRSTDAVVGLVMQRLNELVTFLGVASRQAGQTAEHLIAAEPAFETGTNIFLQVTDGTTNEHGLQAREHTAHYLTLLQGENGQAPLAAAARTAADGLAAALEQIRAVHAQLTDEVLPVNGQVMDGLVTLQTTDAARAEATNRFLDYLVAPGFDSRKGGPL